jgi:hypothetical protein
MKEVENLMVAQLISTIPEFVKLKTHHHLHKRQSLICPKERDLGVF